MTSTTDSTPEADSTGYPRKRARTRRALLTAGREVLAAKGPTGATVGEIARLAHVSNGTFYNHFDSIDEMIDVIVGELASGVEIGRDTLTIIENDPACRVLLGASQLLTLAEDDPSSAAAFASLLATVPVFRERVRSLVAGAMEDGITSGRFAQHETMVLADAVLGSTIQWMRTTLARRDSSSDGDATDRLALLMALLGVPADEVPELLNRVNAILTPVSR